MESTLFLNTNFLQTWRTGPAYRWSRATAPTCPTTSPPYPTSSATPPASRWTPSSTPSSKTICPTAMVLAILGGVSWRLRPTAIGLANPREGFSAAYTKFPGRKTGGISLSKSYLQKKDVLSVLLIIMLYIQLEILTILR
jgi:hypothetical protein